VLENHPYGFLIVSQSQQLLYSNIQAKEINLSGHLFCPNTKTLVHSELNSLVSESNTEQIQLDSLEVVIQPIEYHEQDCRLIKLISNKPQSDLSNKVNLGLVSFDLTGKIISTNNFFRKIIKQPVYHIEELIYGNVDDFLSIAKSNSSKRSHWQTIKLKHISRNRHYEFLVNQHQQHCLLQLRDVTRLTLKHKELQQKATIDPLTGLANRKVFEDRLSQALIRTTRNQQKLALVIIDLDDFKQVNDSLGHQVGDELLHLVAMRIKQHVRKSDTTARLGGDEFCVIYEQIKSSQIVKDKLRKLNEAIGMPITLQGQTLFIKASLGACITDGELDESETFKRADAAMYSAKKMKRGSIKIHQETGSFNHNKSIKQQLNKEINYNQFELFFQPSVTTNEHNVCSIEALLRWRKNGKAFLPKGFFNVIESEGHANKIESWVVHEACRCRKSWSVKRLVSDEVPISINISKSYFYHPNFIPHLKNELARFNLSPHMVELDIEENVLTSAEKKSSEIIKKLADIGVTIAIDHFGASHASLRTLHHFPVRRIKLDKQLVANLNPENNLLVKSIIHAAQELNIEVVGEGVENKEIVKFYTECDCDALQGFIIARPKKQQALENFLQNFAIN
jgi:diguanylate cyclase (GGDEF)-like protein